MRNIFLTISVWMSCQIYGFSQQITWYRVNDMGYSSSTTAFILPFGSGSVAYLWGDNYQHSTGITPTRNGVIRMDSLGNILWHKLLVYPASSKPELQGHFIHGLTIAKDSTIYTTSFAFDTNNIGGCLLNKFDKDGNYLWHKLYTLGASELASRTHGITLNPDSLGVTLGVSYRYPDNFNKLRPMIVKLDSAGQVIFSQVYDYGFRGGGYKMPIQTMPDGSIRMAYDSYNVSQPKDYLISTDEDGNMLDTFTNPLVCKSIDLKLHPNGNLVYLVDDPTIAITTPGTGVPQMRLIMVDGTTLDTLWTRLLHHPNNTTEFFGIEPFNLSIHPDGRILVWGGGGNGGYLVCYSALGNQLWKREITIENFSSKGESTWASDGGILLGGNLRYTWAGVDTAYHYNFVLKLDGLGCLVPGCTEVYISNPTPSPPILSAPDVINGDQDIAYLVSPNPATTELNFTFLGQSPPKEARIELYDVIGRIVKEETIDDTSHFRMNISALPNGYYIAKIMDIASKRLVFTREIIKIGN